MVHVLFCAELPKETKERNASALTLSCLEIRMHGDKQSHFSNFTCPQKENQNITTTGFINVQYKLAEVDYLSCSLDVVSFEIGDEKFLTVLTIKPNEQNTILFQSKQNPNNTISITHTYEKSMTVSTFMSFSTLLMRLLDEHFSHFEIKSHKQVGNNFCSTSVDLGSIITNISLPMSPPSSGLWGVYICRYPNGYPHVDNPYEAKVGYHLTNGIEKFEKYFDLSKETEKYFERFKEMDTNSILKINFDTGIIHRIVFDNGIKITVNLMNISLAKILRKYTYKDEYLCNIDAEYLGCEIFSIEATRPFNFQIK